MVLHHGLKKQTSLRTNTTPAGGHWVPTAHCELAALAGIRCQRGPNVQAHFGQKKQVSKQAVAQ